MMFLIPARRTFANVATRMTPPFMRHAVRELAIAAVWLFLSAGLFSIESEVQGDVAVYVNRGKWVALAFAVINALRPLVKWGGLSVLRKLGWIAPSPNDYYDEPPPRPRVVTEKPDDRIQPPPPPPGAFRS